MSSNDPETPPKDTGKSPEDAAAQGSAEDSTTTESGGGRKPRLDPTRYGDWELNGRCIDF